MLNFLKILMLIPFLASCSGGKGAYEAMQTGGKNDCQKLFGDEYDRCVERYSKPYDEYKRERDEVLDKS